MRILLVSLLAIPFLTFSQIDPEDVVLDSAILNSKQFKRLMDYGERRKTSENGDWAKWMAWNELDHSPSKAPMFPWQNFGPDTVSGRMISIAFHPTDPNTFLAGSASGGLWRTTDYGSSWEVLTDDYFTMGIGAVAYNPQNPNTILIATGEAYGFGNEFTAGYGLLASYDGGETWNTTSIAATLDQNFAALDIIWNPIDTMKIVLSCSFGIYASDDSGGSWTYTLDRIGGRMMADPVDPDRIYFIARYLSPTYPGGFYVSIDGGMTWALSGTGLPVADDIGFSSIYVHPIYNNQIYLSLSQSTALGSGPLLGLYKSSDFGVNFTQILSGTDYLCYPIPYETICLGWYANTILVSSSDTTTYFAGGPRLWKSSDEGINWDNIDEDPTETFYAVHPDHHQTLFHPLTGDLFDIHDGGINFSSDSGATWTSLSEGLITHQFYSIDFAETDPDWVLGGTQDVGTFLSQDAHEGNWTNPFSGDGFGHLISHDDKYDMYGTLYLGFVRMKSVNGGDTWFDINTGTSGADQWRMPIAMDPSNSNLLLSSNDNFIYRSTNAGNNWTPVAAVGQIGTFEFDPLNPNTVYAHALNWNTTYKSLDGGGTWAFSGSFPPEPITDLACDPNNSGVVYASIGSFDPGEQLFKTEDGGDSWINISAGLPQVPVATVAVSPYNSEEIYVGNEIGVWVSLDGGLSWEEFNDGLPAAVPVEDLHFYAPDTTIRIGTYGRGYWRTKALASVLAQIDPDYRENVQVFPNPSNNVFHLSEYLGDYQIFNTIGHVIMSSDSQIIDLSEFSNGLYTLRSRDKSIRLLKQ